MIVSSRPSAVRVLGKSMHTLAAGWTLAVGWLWLAEMQQDIFRQGVAPHESTATLVSGLIPAAVLVLVGRAITQWSGPAPDQALQRLEWWHAFWWSAVPNVLLFITVWVMIQEGK